MHAKVLIEQIILRRQLLWFKKDCIACSCELISCNAVEKD